jgi:riboflavin synthase
VLPALIPKGYVTIDGASLTLTEVSDAERTFGIMLIAHSQEKLVLSTKKPGMKVNIEADSVIKAVEKSVQTALGGKTGSELEALVERVVEKVLKNKGLL